MKLATIATSIALALTATAAQSQVSQYAAAQSMCYATTYMQYLVSGQEVYVSASEQFLERFAENTGFEISQEERLQLLDITNDIMNGDEYMLRISANLCINIHLAQ